MGKLEDYINGLESQENPDLTAVVSDLLKLGNEEIGIRDSKIAEITGQLSDSNSAIAERDAEITKWKAKNFDLAMLIPGNDNGNQEEDNSEVTPSTIKPDDLFD